MFLVCEKSKEAQVCVCVILCVIVLVSRKASSRREKGHFSFMEQYKWWYCDTLKR
jgi:hypothetical protein